MYAGNKHNNNHNNNPQIEATQFAAETSKIRLLKGYIYAQETRQLGAGDNDTYYLVCRRFWHKDLAASELQRSDKDAHFNYQEQFSILNDELFLQRVEKQHLQLELWRSHAADNGNCEVAPVGIVRLPLHQYFIAYRDAAMTNHLCKGKLPVISVDGWCPVAQYETCETLGELKCLLAIGSEQQIEHLKSTRGLVATGNSNSAFTCHKMASLFSNTPVEHPSAVAAQLKSKLSKVMTSCSGNNSPARAAGAAVANTTGNNKLKNTADLLDMLQSALTSPPTAAVAATTNTATRVQSTSAATTATPTPPVASKSFMFALDIIGAANLPLNPAVKGKKGAKRNAANAKQNRFPPNEPPSVYVTFQADEGHGKMFKSHEGLVYASNIVERSTQPSWQQRFRVVTSLDYLSNPQKRFILKIWKKAATDLAQCRLQPTPMEDAIVGFAALDLSCFLRGMQLGGWFNIVDFNGRINGQLEIKCQSLEAISPLLQSLCPAAAVAPTTSAPVAAAAADSSNMEQIIDQFETTLELSHLNLGQAIKRKFSELEQISQRLRTRLVDVTGEQFAANFNMNSLDAMQDMDASLTATADALFDEFELDLKTPPNEAATSVVDDESSGDEPKIKMISVSPPLAVAVTEQQAKAAPSSGGAAPQ